MQKKFNNGFTSLLTVVIIGAALLVLAKSAALVSLDEIGAGDMLARRDRSYAMAQSCLHEILSGWRANDSLNDYTVNLEMGGDFCSATLAGTGDDRTVILSGRSGNFSTNAEVLASIFSESIFINSWDIK